MEDSSVTEVTRNLAISINQEYGNVGVAVQANLFRTKKDLTILINKNVSVRLVKGAYQEKPDIAYQDYCSISGCFFDYAAKMYSKRANKPAIGTHDEELLDDIKELTSSSSASILSRRHDSSSSLPAIELINFIFLSPKSIEIY